MMKHDVEIPKYVEIVNDGIYREAIPTYININPELERMIREIHEKLCGDKK
ncbi:MAG: hypothetical protein ABFD79_05340 [Phycisphaerales bacterium]